MDQHRDRSDSANEPAPGPEPAALSRISSNLGTLLVAAIMVGGIWWWMVDTIQSPSTEPLEPPETHTANKHPRAVAANGNVDGKTHQVVEKTATDDGVQAAGFGGEVDYLIYHERRFGDWPVGLDALGNAAIRGIDHIKIAVEIAKLIEEAMAFYDREMERYAAD